MGTLADAAYEMLKTKGIPIQVPTTVTTVDPAIAKRLRLIAKKYVELETERDEMIILAHQQGASLREIAAVAGMSHVGIKKLLGRHLHPDGQRRLDEELPD